MTYLILLPLFFAAILSYFRIANYYNITDHPNERSSHTHPTIRGGGIIFLFAAAVAMVLHSGYWVSITGIFIIGIVSFLDDQYTLSNTIRVIFQLIAVTLLFVHESLFSIWPIYVCFLLYILIIGIINAYNFMDGINGITGAYSLVVLGGLQYINLQQVHFVSEDLIWLPMLACIVFLYFNFRKKAKCFAGDVGSVTIAFWIAMLLLRLIIVSNTPAYIFFLAVYGVDTVLTIIHRLWIKENIFKPHRLHFFQVLANQQKIPHLWVSSLYAFFQLVIIVWIIKNPTVFWLDFAVTCMPLIIIYVMLKVRLMKVKPL